MKSAKMMIFQIVLAGLVGGAVLMFGGPAAIDSGGFTSIASARFGRPLTPLSYAGVARRTTRRAVAYGAAAGYGAAVYGPRCVQAVDAYGRIYTRCY